MRNTESVAFCVFIEFDLVYKHSSEKNSIRWILLLLVVVNEQSLVAQYIVPISHRSSSLTNLKQFTFLRNLGIHGR